MLVNNQALEEAIRNVIALIGDDPERPGLKETPKRVADMYQEIFKSTDQEKFVEGKTFAIADLKTTQMVLLKDMPFYSMCEHHLLPFFGSIHLAYLPQGQQVVGLSKILRLIDFAAKKLTIQENLTQEVAQCLMGIVEPSGVAVVVEARHLCLEMRGVEKVGVTTRTSYFTGEFETDIEKKQEFLMSL